MTLTPVQKRAITEVRTYFGSPEFKKRVALGLPVRSGEVYGTSRAGGVTPALLDRDAAQAFVADRDTEAITYVVVCDATPVLWVRGRDLVVPELRDDMLKQLRVQRRVLAFLT